MMIKIFRQILVTTHYIYNLALFFSTQRQGEQHSQASLSAQFPCGRCPLKLYQLGDDAYIFLRLVKSTRGNRLSVNVHDV